jgi:hypothetical protein
MKKLNLISLLFASAILILFLILISCKSQYDTQERKITMKSDFFKDSLEFEADFIIETQNVLERTDMINSYPIILLKPNFDLHIKNYYSYKINSINFKYIDVDQVFLQEIARRKVSYDNEIISKITASDNSTTLFLDHEMTIMVRHLRIKCYFLGYKDARIYNPANKKVDMEKILYYIITEAK